MHMHEHGIDLPGVRNARELGGYMIGGKTVKRGILLRTGSLTDITDEAKAILADRYHLQKIVDFRMSEEAMVLPDPVIPGAEIIRLPMMETQDMDAPDPEFVARYSNPAVDMISKYEMIYERQIINDQLYVDFLRKERGKRSVKRFFDELADLDDGRAILWHCKDGKDRTGLAAVLLLCSLGADRETALRDFMLTNEFNKDLTDAAKKEAGAHGFSRDKTDIYVFVNGGVIRRFMEHALEYLDENYGGVSGYLDEIGVHEEARRLLYDKFLQ